jgi:hypothetical protein
LGVIRERGGGFDVPEQADAARATIAMQERQDVTTRV